MIQWIGAICVVGACGACGFSMAASYTGLQRCLQQLQNGLELMQCQMEYQMTELPELCAILAKKALLRPVDQHNEDPFYAEMEARILEKINRLGIGPQGLGGQTTALAVAINAYPTHIAGLPCCVNLGCHVTRHATKVL